MSYKLYTDKKENFECNIYLEGASLSSADARLIIESNDVNLVFKGNIDKNGKCQVPIKRLKGLLDENDGGRMKLEVIAEDTYFQPWSSDFTVETSKKIKVEFNKKEEKKNYPDGFESVPSKPRMVVSEVKNYVNPVKKVSNVLNENGITLKTIVKNKKKVVPLLKEYSKKLNYKKGEKKFITEVIKNLKRN